MKHFEKMDDASYGFVGAFSFTLMHSWKRTLPISKAVVAVRQELTEQRRTRKIDGAPDLVEGW